MAVASQKITLQHESVSALARLSKPTIYNYLRDEEHDFPKQVRLGPNRVVWVKSEIERWLKRRKDARHVEQQAAA